MGAKSLKPNADEVKTWLLTTLKHSMHVEFFFNQLGIGNKDPQRPHDLDGHGNKFEWPVISGLSLLYRQPKVDFAGYVMPAIEYHRQQYHHQMWNGFRGRENEINPAATGADLQVGALDAICSLLENREYQGGAHSLDQTESVLLRNPPEKVRWIQHVIAGMRQITKPSIDAVTSLTDFPNIGIPAEIYARTQVRVDETLRMLRDEHFYHIK